MTTVQALYPIYCSNAGVGHTCLSLCDHMRGADFDVWLTVPTTERADRRAFVRDVVPYWLRSLSCRTSMRGIRHWCTERRFAAQLRPGDIAYLWPSVSLRTYEQIHARGHRIIIERINCHRATARRILEAAYERLGWPPSHGITDGAIAAESAKLGIADHVFCPSPHVAGSMLDAGVPEPRLLRASYGQDPARLQASRAALPTGSGTTFLFVGFGTVRKGLPFLLRAWARSRINGRLILAGGLASDVAERCADDLSRPDVFAVPECPDVAGLYASADVFVLPTLEEGSPLVSYEALASGLPIITTPMGAGEIVRDGREGIVCSPMDEEALVAAMRTLDKNAELRQVMGSSACRRAEAFTWQRVAARRRSQLQSLSAARSAAA